GQVSFGTRVPILAHQPLATAVARLLAYPPLLAGRAPAIVAGDAESPPGRATPRALAARSSRRSGRVRPLTRRRRPGRLPGVLPCCPGRGHLFRESTRAQQFPARGRLGPAVRRRAGRRPPRPSPGPPDPGR